MGRFATSESRSLVTLYIVGEHTIEHQMLARNDLSGDADNKGDGKERPCAGVCVVGVELSPIGSVL